MVYSSVLQGSIIVLVFAYIALGPYASIYEQAIDQIKGPVEIAYRSVKNAVYDIYLLATNPTEWYARQQVINSRPEKPISFPKALEVESVDVAPPSVPGGQPFVMNFVMKHEGDFPAAQIQVAVSCNQWCSVPPPVDKLGQLPVYLCYQKRYLRGDQFYCAQNCVDDIKVMPNVMFLSDCVKQCKDEAAKPKVHTITNPFGANIDIPVQNKCLTNDLNQLARTYWPRDPSDRATMIRGESQIVTVEPFVTSVFQGGAAEIRIAKVYLNVSYEYSTTSQLLVTVLGEDEKQRLINERKLEFKPVVATSKVSPAKLSINVGPQPLQAGKDATLLISVSNDRDDSRIILPEDTPIIITLPLEIGSGLTCPGAFDSVHFVDAEGKVTDQSHAIAEMLIYNVKPDPKTNRIEILPFEFNSIYTFICKFKPSPEIRDIKTGIVTVNLTSYNFIHTIIKDVPVTTPLGIIFDPYDSYCNKAGDQKQCRERSDLDTRKIGTCYYDALLGAASEVFGTTCHSCGTEPKCEQFLTEAACSGKNGLPGEAFDRCRISCQWNSAGVTYVHGKEFPGKCEPAPSRTRVTVGALNGEVADRIVQAASRMKPPGADQQVRDEGIASSFEEMILKLASVESSFRHCNNGKLDCTNDKTYDTVLCSVIGSRRDSCGVMQISVFGANTRWKDSTTDYGCSGKGAYDIDCNIKIGIGLLIDNYNNYKNGIPESSVACQQEPYRSQYLGYKGWKAALRAYNGMGCPSSYPGGGAAAAAGFVDSIVNRQLPAGIVKTSGPASYSKADLMGLGTRTGLHPSVQQALNDMKAAAEKEGFKFSVISGYKSFSQQLDAWNNDVQRIKRNNPAMPDGEIAPIVIGIDGIAVPGAFASHWGTEIEINSLDKKDWQPECVGQTCQGALFVWLKEHAKQFGFCQPFNENRLGVSAQPWHWSYAPISTVLSVQYMYAINVNDLKGRGIALESIIAGDFSSYTPFADTAYGDCSDAAKVGVRRDIGNVKNPPGAPLDVIHEPELPSYTIKDSITITAWTSLSKSEVSKITIYVKDSQSIVAYQQQCSSDDRCEMVISGMTPGDYTYSAELIDTSGKVYIATSVKRIEVR